MTRRRRLQSGRFPWFGPCETTQVQPLEHSRYSSSSNSSNLWYLPKVRYLGGAAPLPPAQISNHCPGPQINPESIKNQCNFSSIFDIDFESIFERFGFHFGSIWDAQIVLLDTQIALGHLPGSKTLICTKSYTN